MKNKLFIATIASAIAIPAVVAPTPTQAEVAYFTDVPKSFWAYKEIMAMRTAGIINGYPDSTFQPAKSISRAHVASLFARSLDLIDVREGQEFADVPKTHPYHDDIQKVYRAGIFDGKDGGNFDPEGLLTRAQMAKILHLAFNLETKSEHPFPDIAGDHWAKGHIASLYASGITTGSEGKFKPNEVVSRANYAVFLHRALNPAQTEQPDEKPEVKPPVDEDVNPGDEGLPQPPAELVDLLNQAKKDNSDLYMEKGPFLMTSFHLNPISAKLYMDGNDALRKTNLKHYLGWDDSYHSTIRLKSEGYKNPIERLGDLEFAFQGSGEKEGKIFYDFRSDDAHALAKEWLVLLNPEFEVLLPQLDQKVMEARAKEKEQVGNPDNVFNGNSSIDKVGEHSVQNGVNGFYEWMNIHFKLGEW